MTSERKQSSKTKDRRKRPAFPLWLHTSGRCCKKIRNRFFYFGPESDPDGALARWMRVKDDLLAGA